jgi:DNA-binding XRE family transcriptional regulator
LKIARFFCGKSERSAGEALTKVIVYDNFYIVIVEEERDMEEINSARQEVASQLKQVRRDQGMTQESLAELVGTKKSNISRLESGRYNPSLDFLVKVAGGLGKQIHVKLK